MTDRELMQQALEALEIESKGYNDKVVRNRGIITALRERLAQPEQEPVAWGMRDMNGHIYDCISVEEHERAEGDYNVPLYTAPPRREWVGLTLEEIGLLTTGDGWSHLETPALALFARAIEAKLKEKNA